MSATQWRRLTATLWFAPWLLVAWRGGGRARQPRWVGSPVLAVAAAEIVWVPPAAVSLADRLEFLLGVGRWDRGAAASGQEGRNDHEEHHSTR